MTQSADGAEVAYERRGDGQPLILLHGGMAPREYWNAVVPHFDDFGAVLPRRPGFGTCLDSLETTSAADVLDREIILFVLVTAYVTESDGISVGPARQEA